MKKVLFVVVSILFAVGSASAMPVALDPSALSSVLALDGTYSDWSAFTATDVGNGFDLDADTTSTLLGGPNFTDDGNVAITDMNLPFGGSDAGLGVSWGLIGGWRGLTGQVTAGGYVYDAGAVMTLYAFQAVNGSYSFGDSYDGANDAPGIGNDSGFSVPELTAAKAVKVAELELVNGFGGPAAIGNALELYWKYTYLAPGFWVGNAGPLSLADLGAGEYFQFFADTKTSLYDATTVPGQILARHHIDGVVDVVPEPATMALFGSGLFGLAGAGLRKKKKA